MLKLNFKIYKKIILIYYYKKFKKKNITKISTTLQASSLTSSDSTTLQASSFRIHKDFIVGPGLHLKHPMSCQIATARRL